MYPDKPTSRIGYDPDRPMPTTDALAAVLRALGLRGEEVPVDVDERAAAYRSLLDGRHMLVVLDNASTVEHVRPLLPGGDSCVVIVTSRDSLAGLVARDGAHRIELDLLPPADALALLRAMIGVRVDEDPDAAETLAHQCACLPLALRVAAEIAVARPDDPLSTLVRELTLEQRRLELLDAGGDPRTAVRAVFSWSYRRLTDGAACLFRLLGHHPGPDLTAYAAAAVAGITLTEAGQLLGQLARAHLVQRTGPERFGMHDLLRAYGVGLSSTVDDAQERSTSLTRLFDHYVGMTAAAVDTLHPTEKHRRSVVAPPAGPAPDVGTIDTALAWLDAERRNVVAICAYAASHDWPRHAVDLSSQLSRHLDMHGHIPEGQAIHTVAREAARRLGDASAEARSTIQLGITHGRRSWHGDAERYFREAIELLHDSDDLMAHGGARHNLALALWHRGRAGESLDLSVQALALFRRAGDRIGEVAALGNQGIYHMRQGRPDDARRAMVAAVSLAGHVNSILLAQNLISLAELDRRQGHYADAETHLRRGIETARRHRDHLGEAVARNDLGLLLALQGHLEPAQEHIAAALATFRAGPHADGEATAYARLGEIRRLGGALDEAADLQERALAMFRAMGDPGGEGETLNRLGNTRLARGELDAAEALFTSSVELARRGGITSDEADALAGLGDVHLQRGQAASACRQWRQALLLYRAVGAPDAGRLALRLDATAHSRA